MKYIHALTLSLSSLCLLSSEPLFAKTDAAITDIRQVNSTTVELTFANKGKMIVDFYGDNIFRLFQDNNGGELRDPEAKPAASILVDNPRQPLTGLSISKKGQSLTISTPKVNLSFDRKTGLFTAYYHTGLKTHRSIVSQTRPIDYTRSKYTLYLSEGATEYYYGGGVQNGRFSHRGEEIEIVNTNSWTDGGVASPAPFYWSTGGYALMGYTFAPGLYDFGKDKEGEVAISHESPYLDLFLMLEDPDHSLPATNQESGNSMALLDDYYQLTGQPVLLPKFAFYEGHLNAYNRDYWLESPAPEPGRKYRGSILFEDGKYYKESQKDNGGIKESLNGEKDNYQFSARAVIDRYERADMPLGWILPNDGYGAGYGQTETLDGNIENLKQFGEYARKHGVEIGLWTQSELHPVEGVSALLQRDIIKEVHDAGVRVLKTDVAWVGDGYSFGLNGVADVAKIMPEFGDNARPFIISLDGWAGTHRYAAIWTGDQTGGKWEYIRFHLPTYIGSGLSGIGNITSDMDGIYGGGDTIINVRDFEWKTFTPMQLNMDGWGYAPKYPNVAGEPATSINRSYLKLKSMLLPYSYAYAHEASVGGKPLMRAMFLDYPNDYTFGPSTCYQYMYGPSFLVAPVYQATAIDTLGNDIRDGIYLPEGEWIDYFTGDVYQGGVLLNNFEAPFWKLPLFVRPGAIIPMYLPSNNPSQIDHSHLLVECYPAEGNYSFETYDDDGTTEAYLKGESKTATISQSLEGSHWEMTLPSNPQFGASTSPCYTIILNTTSRPHNLKAQTGKEDIALHEVHSLEALMQQSNTYYYEECSVSPNRFAFDPSASFIQENQRHASRLWINVDAQQAATTLALDAVAYHAPVSLASKHGALQAPSIDAIKSTPYSLTPIWKPVPNADYYEIEYEGQRYSAIHNNHLLFGDLKPETNRTFRLRAVNADGVSGWTDFSALTESNPLEYAIQGITATVPGEADPDHEVSRLFDFATAGDIWFDDMAKDSATDTYLPYVLVMDLHCTTQVQELRYLPREGGGNGGIQDCTFEVSTDGKNYAPVGSYHWTANDSTRIVPFTGNPEVRYIRMTIQSSRGGYVAGREVYVFRTPGSKVRIPGDITQDGKIDDADLSGYLNYTGLRSIDPDFEGYVSHADLNGNGLIDAQDISEVATKLDGGIHPDGGTVAGSLTLVADKEQYQAGDEMILTVRGKGLEAVNALSLSLPYNESDLKFEAIEPLAVAQMQNLTNDRLHKDGQKVLYPTFVNVGDKETLHGDADLFAIRFHVLRATSAEEFKAEGLLVDKFLNAIEAMK